MDEKNNENRYSVLMSVYAKERAEFLRAAMNSMWRQTVPTNDFVLVCDGPLNAELDAVIEEMEHTYPNILHVLRLKTNSGLGNALNVGIKHCKNDLVARMDSDDISRPDRCEKQLGVFGKQPNVSICSGIIEEFSTSTNEIEAQRVTPEKQEHILAFAKKRSPFNHACVMYKRSAVESAGGYLHCYLLEDYYLWVRMLQNGAIGYNLQVPLMWVRTGPGMYKRRAGWKYAKSQKALFKYMKDSGFISFWQYLISVTIRFISSIIPNWLRECLFKTLFRNK